MFTKSTRPGSDPRRRRGDLHPHAPRYTYQRTFAFYEAGVGSAMAILMFIMLVIITAHLFPPVQARGGPVTLAPRPSPQLSTSPHHRPSARDLLPSRSPGFLHGLQGIPRDIRHAAHTHSAHVDAGQSPAAVHGDTRPHYLRNSIIVSFSTVLLTVAVATPRRLQSHALPLPGREQIAGTVLFTYMFAHHHDHHPVLRDDALPSASPTLISVSCWLIRRSACRSPCGCCAHSSRASRSTSSRRR